MQRRRRSLQLGHGLGGELCGIRWRRLWWFSDRDPDVALESVVGFVAARGRAIHGVKVTF
jgi:hypothetical protein